MIERTYRCDLCRDQYPLEQLVQIRWDTAMNIVVNDIDRHGQSERHLCRSCIADIKAMVVPEEKP